MLRIKEAINKNKMTVKIRKLFSQTKRSRPGKII